MIIFQINILCCERRLMVVDIRVSGTSSIFNFKGQDPEQKLLYMYLISYRNYQLESKAVICKPTSFVLSANSNWIYN